MFRSPRRLGAALLSTAFLLAGLVAPSSAAADPELKTFERMVTSRALHSGNDAVANAVQTLAQEGFLADVLFLARNLDADQPAPDGEPMGWWGVKRMKGRLEGLAKGWIKRQRKDGYRYSDHQLEELRWQPGKRYAVLRMIVEMKEGLGPFGTHLSGTAFYKYALTLKVDTSTMDVVQHRWGQAP